MPLSLRQCPRAGVFNTVCCAAVCAASHASQISYTTRDDDSGAVVNTGPADEDEDECCGGGGAKPELWDLLRPLEGDCKLELKTFDDAEGKMVFWHSSAHVLGECMECDYGVKLCIGPPTQDGFYYGVARRAPVLSLYLSWTLTRCVRCCVLPTPSLQSLAPSALPFQPLTLLLSSCVLLLLLLLLLLLERRRVHGRRVHHGQGLRSAEGQGREGVRGEAALRPHRAHEGGGAPLTLTRALYSCPRVPSVSVTPLPTSVCAYARRWSCSRTTPSR